MSITLTKEVEQELINSIKQFFDEQYEQDIGDLKASLLLDFVLKEIGPYIYNRAVMDAQRYMMEKVTDLDSACIEPETGYWK